MKFRRGKSPRHHAVARDAPTVRHIDADQRRRGVAGQRVTAIDASLTWLATVIQFTCGTDLSSMT